MKQLYTYFKESFTADTFAALTIWAILIPQSIAYSEIAGIPAVYGLYCALVSTGIASIFGTTKFLSTGPVAVASFLTYSILAPLTSGGSTEYIILASLLAILVGIIQVLVGRFQLGGIIRMIPHPVVLGFSGAVAIIIISSQLPSVLGISIARSMTLIGTVELLLPKISSINIQIVLFSLCTGLILTFYKRLLPKAPSALLTIVTTACLVHFFHLDFIKTIGEISVALPTVVIPPSTLATLQSLISGAIVIAVIGFSEAFAVAESLSKKEGSAKTIDVNQELVAQGLANIASGFVQGYPVSGSFSRSALLFQAKPKTKYTGVIISLFVGATILWLSPVLRFIPKATLAVIIIMAVYQLIQIKHMNHLLNTARFDGIASYVTFFACLLLEPEAGLLIGVVLSLSYLVYRLSTPDVICARLTEEGRATHIEVSDYLKSDNETLIMRIDSPCIYLNIHKITSTISSMVRDITKEVLIDCSAVIFIDSTGFETLSELKRDLNSRGIVVKFINTKYKMRQILEKSTEYDEVVS